MQTLPRFLCGGSGAAARLQGVGTPECSLLRGLPPQSQKPPPPGPQAHPWRAEVRGGSADTAPGGRPACGDPKEPVRGSCRWDVLPITPMEMPGTEQVRRGRGRQASHQPAVQSVVGNKGGTSNLYKQPESLSGSNTPQRVAGNACGQSSLSGFPRTTDRPAPCNLTLTLPGPTVRAVAGPGWALPHVLRCQDRLRAAWVVRAAGCRAPVPGCPAQGPPPAAHGGLEQGL